MTRRERLEMKLEKRHEWAVKRNQAADKCFEVASKDAEAFYGGQPILVGHHSEGKARRLQEKIHNNGFAGVENLKMAEHHESKAVGLEIYLDNTIFDDDPDAVEKMESKISALEQRQKNMLAINKICRNKKLDDTAKIAQIMELGESEEQAKIILHPEHSWQCVGFAACTLTNNGANIRRCKDRLATLKGVKSLKERAEKSSSGIVIDRFWNGEKMRITFSEKPDRETINALKEAGFRWCKCCWIGDSDKVPQAILEAEAKQ